MNPTTQKVYAVN